MKDEISIVENALKVLGEPTRLSDLVDLTKDEINWGVNPTSRMSIILDKTPRIRRERRGFYEYVDEPPIKTNSIQIIRDEHRPSYKIGEIFTGNVTGIESYGVFVENEMGDSGLVHYTAMKKGENVQDPHRYFKLGEEVKAKIIQIKPENKLSLSTFDIPLPNYDVQYATINDIQIDLKENEQIPKENMNIYKDSEDFILLSEYFKKIVGFVSEPAREKLEKLVNTVGLVKFMISLSEEEKDFKVDLGLQLLDAVEKRINSNTK